MTVWRANSRQPREREQRYPAELATPATARAFVRKCLEDWERSDLSDEACLLTSELVTNAIVHGQSELSVKVQLAQRALSVEIRDENPSLVRSQVVAELAESGRGLQIVEALSLTWGVRPAPGGKAVWFSLDASAPASGR